MRKRIEKERERKNRYTALHTHREQSYCKLTQSYIPGSASRRVQEEWSSAYMACVIQLSFIVGRRKADRLHLALPAALQPPPPQPHSSGSDLPHYSFGSSAPFVTSFPRVGADLFSSLPPGGPVVPPNIWD
jgi:hypothetical protein